MDCGVRAPGFEFKQISWTFLFVSLMEEAAAAALKYKK